MSNHNMRPRTRAMGIAPGRLSPGPHNAITDVAGVRVGHVTLIQGEGPLVPGQGPIRTGVTAILPHGGDLFLDKVVGVVHTINGFGEVTNAHQVTELGVLEGPIMITNTLNVPRVADAVIDWALARNPQMGVTTWGISPIVAECSDMYLNDIRGRHVKAEHVLAAIERASDGPVEEGNVGAGTGMSCYGFKGGVGTSSRVVLAGAGRYTVGVLLVSNFGSRERLMIDGVPVGRLLADWLAESVEPARPEGGSVVVVLATDAPLSDRQVGRLARRVAHGLARTGSVAGTTSGDFVIAFTTANRVAHQSQSASYPMTCLAESWEIINPFFEAVVEATEEAVLNSLCRAQTLVGRDEHVRHALPLEQVVDIMHRFGHAQVHLP
ncbi:MAG: P1 family peptidase [Anaerolineae bacterium]